MSDQTHLSTLEAEVRRVANSCDLGGFNADYFLKGCFVRDIALLIQARELEAYRRGIAAAERPTIGKRRDPTLFKPPSPLSER